MLEKSLVLAVCVVALAALVVKVLLQRRLSRRETPDKRD